MAKLRTTPTFRRAIQGWLKAGLLDGAARFPTDAGTPQGGPLSPLLANIALHGLETDLRAAYPRARYQEGRGHGGGGQPVVVRYADDVRRITRCSIPFTERRGSEDQTSGSTAYLAAKAQGDGSMPLKRGRAEDAYGRAPQGPREMVKATLLEP